MKKTMMIIMMVLMMSTSLVYANDGNPQFKATVLSYSPVPAEPGSYITLNIKLENTGDGKADDAVIEFIDNYPFTVEQVSEKTKDIGELDSGEDYIAEYRVRIDDRAAQGTNYIKIRYNSDASSAGWIEKELPLTIQSSQKTVSISAVTNSPEVINPGEESNIVIKVSNSGSSNIRDVSLELDLAERVVGTNYIDLPFGPVGSSAEKRVAFLGSGQTEDFTFTLQSYPGAETGIYKIPITLSYTDEDGESISEDDLISIIVGSSSDIMLQVDSSSVYSDQPNGEVIFSVTNKGFDEIKFATFEIMANEEFEVMSTSNREYLGNIDSDDYETATFTIKLTAENVEEVNLPVKVTFKDSLNKEYKTERTITLPVMTLEEAGLGKSSSGSTIVFVLIILVVGYFLYRRHKKKKRR